MGDLSKLNAEASGWIFDIVGELQPVTVGRVRDELAQRHGLEAEVAQVKRYMEFLRSGFPKKLAHAGPEAWTLVDLEA